MNSPEVDALWTDPQNWTSDDSYSCAHDSRLMVPKRLGGGWTLNMGHPRAQVAMWMLLLVIVTFVVAIGVWSARAT